MRASTAPGPKSSKANPSPTTGSPPNFDPTASPPAPSASPTSAPKATSSTTSPTPSAATSPTPKSKPCAQNPNLPSLPLTAPPLPFRRGEERDNDELRVQRSSLVHPEPYIAIR